MTRFLNCRTWPALLGLVLVLMGSGALWAGSINVSMCTPPCGTAAGGTSVTIVGTGFDNVNPGTTVTFGGASATSVVVVDTGTITCNTPAHAVGAVDIDVTNPDTTSGTGFSLYTYSAAAGPTVTLVAPNTGSTAGGDVITITGTGFYGETSVDFGPNPATGDSVNSDTSITVKSPAGTGTVDVRVTTCIGTSPTSASDQFTYASCSMPTVTSVNANSGTTCGGTQVVITGTNFTAATAVDFGTTAALSYTVNSATQITAKSPAHAAGIIDVTVTTSCGTSVTGSGDQFNYTAAPVPTVTLVSPNTGTTAGGTSVTITGTGFTNATAPTVDFGANPATGVAVNAAGTSITCTSPAGAAATVDIRVTTCGGTSAIVAADQFTYLNCSVPTVTAVAPNTGTPSGGTPVTITGTNFTGATGVTFGGAPATTVNVVSATSITCVSPAGTGVVDVRVTTPCGTSAVVVADQFTYGTLPAPTVTGINPSHGPQTGGTSVTITGTNFVSGAGLAVYMGATSYPCTSVTFVSSTTLTAVTPAHPVGSTTVGVKNPDNQQGFSSTPLYTYDASAPAVTGVTPNSGPADGGTPVTISGIAFTGATGVAFGTAAATSVVVVNAATITCVSPTHAAGVTDVRVTTSAGTSAIVAADQFTYIACSLACTTTVPSTGQTGAQVQFASTATPTSCTGTVAYAWTFGDGATSTAQNPAHAYTTPGVYSWSMTATIGTTQCYENGSISIITAPTITGIKKMSNPFRLKVMGLNFHPYCVVYVNGTEAVPLSDWKSSVLVVAKKGSALKALFPAGQTVQVTLKNLDDGGVSNAWAFTR